ncbi:hypothetical protein ACSBPH_05975 [Microbacterium sp. F51-2R]|jgi:hypothetical protein|uniref:hypothetical protein n=1 Tax=Microbacterium sp. F51-2R TaxID=3445777 RepID=UPI003F9F47FB
MKHKVIAGALLAAALVLAPVAVTAASAAPPSEKVCADYSTGRITPADGVTEVTYTAPEGQVILAICVKAGSVKQGNGPEAVSVPENATEVTFSHSSGKAIGHYSVLLGDAPDPLACLDGWVDVDTRTSGRYECVDTGLHVWTVDNSSQAKVSFGTAAAFPLASTGVLDIDWTGTGTAPGINLFVDFDGNGSIDGTLVYETVYGQDLWLTNGSAQFVKDGAPSTTGGNGSAWHGTISQWSSSFPAAQVKGVAFSVGSGVNSDGILHSLTAGGIVFSF